MPAGYDPARPPRILPIGSWEILEPGSDAAFLAVGSMVSVALAARALLAEQGVAAAVVNCRFVKPVDRELLSRLRREVPHLVTVEENVLSGGFGDAVLEALEAAGQDAGSVVRIGLPDAFVTHGTRQELLDLVGLSPSHLVRSVLSALGRKPV